MGYPESRKTGGYGAFVVVGFIPMKGSRFISNLSYLNASDLKNLGFNISFDNKIINILSRVRSLDNLLAAYEAIKSKPGNNSRFKNNYFR